MVSLSDAFPKSLKKQMAGRSVEVGSVIYLYDKVADKHKRHLIIGFDKDKILTATLRVNSEINENVYRTEYQKSFCYPIKEADVDFLEWDSFIACDDIMEWNKDGLVDLVSKDPSIVKGSLDSETLEVVRHITSTAKTITPKQKKKFDLI